MTFGSMYQRLITHVRTRVANGDLTERQLARLTGVSQPHIHNVLKGVRVLTADLADEMLHQLRLNAEDLLQAEMPSYSMQFRPIPLLSGELGSGMPLFEPLRTLGSALVPAPVIAEVRSPVTARLGFDMEAAPRFEKGDLILIEQARAARLRFEQDATYVVITASGPRLRYIRLAENGLYLPSESTLPCPEKWETVLFDEGGILSVVRGRVIWVSRHFRTEYVC